MNNNKFFVEFEFKERFIVIMGILFFEDISYNKIVYLLFGEVTKVAKPSMFSKDYDKKMKRRKRRKGFFIVLLIILLVSIPIVVVTNKEFINMEKYISKNVNKENSNDEKIIEEKKDIDEEKKEEVVNNIENIEHVAKFTTEEEIIKISEKENLSIFVEYKDDNKRIKDIKGNENIEYDIDEEGKNAILYNKLNQDITLVDRDLNLKNITRQEYVSTFKEVFSRENVVKNNKGYIWQKNPRFIDENNIAYLSELPWINEGNNLYVWIYNIKDNTHIRISDSRIVGKNIEVKESNKKGIKVKIDDKEYLIDSLGQIK